MLRSLFRGKLLAGLKALHRSGQLRLAGSLAELADPLRFGALLAPLYDQDWVVYVKPPFANPETVLTYLGRYTHRIAISNQRLVGLDGDDVLFRYKDRAAEDRWKIQRLPALEFIRRFLLHVLPERFVRIRYYGLLAHRNRRRDLERCRALLGAPAAGRSPESTDESWQQRLLRLTGFDATLCPHCRRGRLQPIQSLPAKRRHADPRGPP